MEAVLVQTALPDYRQRALEQLAELAGPGFRVLVGDEYFLPSTRTTVDLGDRLERVDNRFLFGRRVVWQRLPFRRLVAAEVVMAELNPRVLSTWVLAAARRLRGRPMVLWGHAWPASGRDSRSEIVRGLQRRLATTIVVYTETQREQLREVMPEMTIIAAPNAVFHADEMVPGSGEARDFLFVGRLIPTKKPGLLLDAFLEVLPDLDPSVRLVFVGDGPLALELRARAADAGDRVRFEGHVSDIARLRAVHADAIASVSPGYVGLSIIQSLGFGTPMIVARDEPHSPEIEAAIEGQTARIVASDDREALGRALIEFAHERADWQAGREDLASWARERYSVEVMADCLAAALRTTRESDDAQG